MNPKHHAFTICNWPTAALLAVIVAGAIAPTMGDQARHAPTYPWPHSQPAAGDRIAERFPPPNGFRRIPAPADGFGFWLRDLPLQPGTGIVHLFNRQPKPDQSSHAAIIDIDVGKSDLQQCADSVIRLRGEYLFSVGEFDAIRFKFTSGDTADYKDWRRGLRPSVRGNRVTWSAKARADASYAGFRDYLDTVFTYAGTQSLAKEMNRVPDAAEVQIGDVWLAPGSPGHAILVVDVVEHETTKERRFLLAQGFMPAQSIHVLKNPKDPKSAWYSIQPGSDLVTPHWTFHPDQLMRFKPLKEAPRTIKSAAKRRRP